MGVWGASSPTARFEGLQQNTCGFNHVIGRPQQSNKTARLIESPPGERGDKQDFQSADAAL